MPPSKETPRQIGRYEIVGALGKGAMGQLYKAVEPSSNRIVAIKVLPKEFLKDEVRLERFHREAQALAMLDHPNVIQVLDKGRDGDLLYFAMEFVPGTSLAAVLRRRRLSLPEAISVFKAICAGLEAAHQKNVIHRDLNPGNILVSEDLSVVKLADFGITRVESLSREMGTLATVDFSMGTLHYAAPEQTADMTTVDHRADIYSAGVTLYEMLTGRVPLGRFNLPSQLNSEVPPELDPIVLKCLASEPSKRYATVGQLQIRMRALEDQLRLGLVSELRGISRSTAKIFRRGTQKLVLNPGKRIAIIGGAAALLVLVGAAVLLSRRPSETPPEPAGLGTTEAPETMHLPEEGAAPSGTSGRLETPAPAVEPDESAIPPRDTIVSIPPPESQPAAARAREQEASLPATRGGPGGPGAAPEDETDAAPAEPAWRDFQVAKDKVEAKLYEPALGDLEALVENYPKSSLLPDAYLLIAEIHERESRIEQALATLVEVESRFGDSPKAVEALFLRGQLMLRTSKRGRVADARQLFGDLARDYPDSRWAPQALVAKAAIEHDQKILHTDPELGSGVPAALATKRELVESYPDHPSVENALWGLGKMYRELKRFDLATASYADLGIRFPETRFEAWWEAAQIYDKKLDMTEDALAAYRRVPDSSARFEAAQKRIKRLEK